MKNDQTVSEHQGLSKRHIQVLLFYVDTENTEKLYIFNQCKQYGADVRHSSLYFILN